MTLSEFTSFYPQFAGFEPACVLFACVDRANARFSSFSPEDAEEARRLFAAHQLTLYARTALPENAELTMARIAGAGEPRQRIASKKAGEVAVTYVSGASSAASVSTDLADLTETSYGLQLLSLIRLYRRSVYVP